MKNRFTEIAGVEVPLLCGPMYPCSNPELVAAVSEAGGLGIIQPLSLVFVHGYEFRDGLNKIRSLTKKPVGLNILTEKSLSAIYRKRMEAYLEASLEAGIRFFITALGNPDWVVKRAHAAGAVVFHDVVDRRWAEKGLAEGVDGLICVNSRAGGHAGRKTPQELRDELSGLGVPLVCAGGVGSEPEFRSMLDLGYEAVQMGTRFIATEECTAHPDYKKAILDAEENDVVLTERITGVPLSIIRTPHVERMGTKAGPVGKWMLKGHRTKHWMRAIYSIRSAFQLKNASMKGASSKDFWQAGKSVATIRSVEPAAAIVRRFAAGLLTVLAFLLPAAAGAVPPEMKKVVTEQASFALYAPAGWQAREGTSGGFRTLVVRDRAGERAAALFHGALPAGTDLETFARQLVAVLASERARLALRRAFVSPDRSRLAFEGVWGPPEARREFRSWLAGRDGAFVYSSIEAPERDLARERPLLLTILANVRIVKGSFRTRGGPPPLFPYRLRDGSASFRIPSGWNVTELGRGQFIAVDKAGSTSFVVSAADVATPKLGVRPPGTPVSPFLPPHEGFAFLASRAGLGSDWRFESVVSRDDLARDVARVYTAGPVQVEEFVHSSMSRGRPMKGYTLGFSLGSRLGTNWIFRHLTVSAPRSDFGARVSTFVAMLQSYAIDETGAKRYVTAGLERLRRLQQETSALVARNADEIHSMMQAAYDERQRSQEWIDYQRTSTIRGTQDWISSVEGGAVYHSDSWGTKNTATGEYREGKPYDSVNFKGENPKYNEQMTPIENRRLYEASKGN